MRTIIAAAAIALGIATAPALAGPEGGVESIFQDACDTMGWQFDSIRSARATHPGFAQALALRDRGMARCDDAAYDEGSAMLRASLQMVGVSPLF